MNKPRQIILHSVMLCIGVLAGFFAIFTLIQLMQNQTSQKIFAPNETHRAFHPDGYSLIAPKTWGTDVDKRRISFYQHSGRYTHIKSD